MSPFNVIASSIACNISTLLHHYKQSKVRFSRLNTQYLRYSSVHIIHLLPVYNTHTQPAPAICIWLMCIHKYTDGYCDMHAKRGEMDEQRTNNKQTKWKFLFVPAHRVSFKQIVRVSWVENVDTDWCASWFIQLNANFLRFRNFDSFDRKQFGFSVITYFTILL